MTPTVDQVGYHLMHRAGLRCASRTSTTIWSFVRTRASINPVAEILDRVVQVTRFDRDYRRYRSKRALTYARYLT